MKHKINIKITLLLGCMLLGAFGMKVNAQAIQTRVEGVVTDEYGKPLQGVVVNTEKGKNGTSTDVYGKYTLSLNDGSENIVFSFLGYADQIRKIADKVDVKMALDAHRSDEIIEMGFTKQRRGDISGAVTSVKGSVVKAPVSILGAALNGYVPGLNIVQSGGNPSNEGFSMLMRGGNNPKSAWSAPLIMIDGVISTFDANEAFNYITPSEIESVTLLKDASTQALYGMKANSGVLVVTTKKGVKGPIKINVTYDQSVQQPSLTPRRYHSDQYATFKNEAAYNDNPLLGKTSVYSPLEIAKYISGEDRNLYPDNDWYSMFFKQLNVMSRAGLNVAGGSDKFTYYTNVNYVHQGNQYKTTNERYKNGYNTNWFDFRSNVSMKINRFMGAFLNLSGNIRRDRSPHSWSASELYSELFYRAPNIYGPVTPATYDSETGELLDAGGKMIVDEKYGTSIYGELNRQGFDKSTTVGINSQFGLNFDLDFVTPGLSLTAAVAYQTYGTGYAYATQTFEKVKRSTRKKDELVFETVGSTQDGTLSYNKPAGGSYYHLDYRANLDYKRDFGKHHVSGDGYFYFQNLSIATGGYTGGSNTVLPYNTAWAGVQAAYDYDNRYYAKFDMGFSATEQFAPEYRWKSTPAGSVAWNISNEPFMKNSRNWLTNLKLRASYGRVAEDGLANGRVGYMDNNTFSGGGLISLLAYVTTEGTKGNRMLQASTVMKQNYGIDLGLFNGLTVSVDYFRERMDDMLIKATSTIPEYQGIPSHNYPSTQVGKYRNHGYEVTANYYKRFNADWSMNLGGWISYARNKLVYRDETTLGEGYAYRKTGEGFPLGTGFGLLVDYSNGNGFFNSQEDIDNYQCTYGGTLKSPRVGDLVYRDLNGDYVIDEKDVAPITYGGLPEVFYAFNAGFTYKNFEFNVMFQGLGRYKSSGYQGGYYSGRSYNGVYNRLLEGAWTAERYARGSKITAPALSENATSSDQMTNDYFVEDRAFLRLKNVEVAYSLPLKYSKKISADKIRFSLSGQNLFTWSQMKNKDIDPEVGSLHVMPTYRVYNIGVSLLF